MTKRIIQIVLAVVIVCLIYVIYKQISTPIIFAKEKAAREARVIDRIKDIRTAERSFKTKYNRFTGDFDTLINFVLTDSLEFERKIVDEDDSVAMAQLKKSGRKNSEKVWVHVIDTIFTPKKLTAEQVRNLRYVPGTNNQTEFELEAGLLQRLMNKGASAESRESGLVKSTTLPRTGLFFPGILLTRI